MWRNLHLLADELSRALAETTDAVELISFAIARCREALDAEGVTVLLLDPQSNQLYCPAVAEKDPVRAARLLQARFAADRGIAGSVLRTRTSVRVDDVSADPRRLSEADFQSGTPRALLCAPLIASERVVGIIRAVNLVGAAVFTDDDLACLDAVALWLADAIGRARRQEDEGRVSEVGDRGTGANNRTPDLSSPKPESIFRKEGDYWTIVFEDRVTRLKDAKGLHYIAYLLRHPGREFHVTELMALVGDTTVPPQGTSGMVHVKPLVDAGDALRVADLGDAGAVLDARAKAEYKRRLDELRAELEEAEHFNDSGRAARAREEIELISDQLTAAVGLGGRDRVVASGAERARLAVTKRIKAALGKIHHADPALGSHLTQAITTGYFCAYVPKATSSVSWTMR